MKTYTAIIAALLFAGGSASALAVDGTTNTDMNQGSTSDFSTIDTDGDGYIDQQDAADAGISQREFEEMNESGDGRVSEEEFRNYQDTQNDSMREQPGATDPQDSQPGDMQPEGESDMPGQERQGLPGTEPGVPGTEPEGQPGTEPGVPGTQPEGEPGMPGEQPGQQPGASPQTPQQPGAVPGEVQPGTQP